MVRSSYREMDQVIYAMWGAVGNSAVTDVSLRQIMDWFDRKFWLDTSGRAKRGGRMTNRNLAFAGAALLVVGLFMPIVTLPMVGAVSTFGNGTNWIAYVLTGLAAVAAYLASKDQTDDVIWPGLGAAAVIVAAFVALQVRIAGAKAQLADGLEGNPFAGLATRFADAIQIQWGWLVLGAGIALMIYASSQERKARELTLLQRRADEDGFAFLSSLILTIGGVGFMVFQLLAEPETSFREATSEPMSDFGSLNAKEDTSVDPAKERYISNEVEVYDVSAKYQDSMLDGRVPGVDFKIRNNGDRSLDTVEVTVKFYNAEGNAIAEEQYYPVLVTSYDNDPPLRPNYIWQQERGRFYAAKSVPDEWEAGKVSAKITDVEFSPSGS